MRGDSVAAGSWLDGSASCEATRDGWELDGSARFVVPADATNFLVVFPTDSGHPSLHVAAHTPGLSITSETRIDGTAAAVLDFKAVQVSQAGLLARAPGAAAASEHARDNALVMAAFYMSGTMRSINAMTQEYLRTRTQFGKPIGSFQALQHKAVDMHIAEQLARDVAQNACTLIDAGCTPDERACLASRAKARAGESLDRIARMPVQLRGAIGFTDEYDLSLHSRRSLGTPEQRDKWLPKMNRSRPTSRC